jgi:hypothetical protein
VVLFASIEKGYIWASVILCREFHFPDARLSKGKQDTGEVILQIPSSLCF